MACKLHELLTEGEIVEISRQNLGHILETEFQNLSIKDIKQIQFIIIATKYGRGNLPFRVYLVPETITILTDRSIKKNISLFE